MIGPRGLRPALIGLGLVVATLLLPTLAGVGIGLVEVASGSSVSPASLGFRGGSAAIVTVAWSLAIGLLASTLGLEPGRRLAAAPHPIEAVVWLVPLLLAPALLFDAWWLQVGPDGRIGTMAAEQGLVPVLRSGVLALGLLGTAVPLATWAHAAERNPVASTLRRLDRPRGRGRVIAACRLDLRPTIRVALLVSMVVAGLTVPFDLAQVGSWGFELRTLDTRGASVGTLLRAGGGAAAVSLVAALLLAGRISGAVRGTSRGGMRPGRDAAWSPRSGRLVVLVLVALPIAMLARRAFEADPAIAWRLHGESAVNTGLVGLFGAVAGASAACFTAGCRIAGGRGTGVAIATIAVASMVALLPATLVAAGAEALWNRPVTAIVYDGPWAMLFAVGGRVVVVPAVLGLVSVPVAGRVLGGPFMLDSPRRSGDVWRATRPAFLIAGLAGGLAGGVLCGTEIPVTARLQPPGFPLLSSALLNAMHYQYVDSVLPVALPVAMTAIPIAGLVALALHRTRVGGRRIAAFLLVSGASCLVTTIPGCDRSVDVSDRREGIQPVPHDVAFGRPGNLDGRFDYPRALAIDPERGRLFVVDKSARVQRFDLDGGFELSWTMPRFENGKPTGISVDRSGRVVVADTHEHRIAIFSPEGELVETHGRMGRGPGEFIYPTDVACGPDGRWYVSEYGGNDRVQIFDADWTPIGVIGFAGEVDEPSRPALSRPQSIAWDERRNELLIADAIHHRIVVVDADGGLRRVLGGPGVEPGRLSYPYGVAVDRDGAVVVAEFGANRIQRLDPDDGTCLSIVGGTGVDAGRLRYPWGVDVRDGTMAVLDSGNSRVLVGPVPDSTTGSADLGS